MRGNSGGKVSVLAGHCEKKSSHQHVSILMFTEMGLF